jgi:hypothetical protein
MKASGLSGLVLVLLILPASASAACRSRDLEGTFDLTAESTGVYGTITTTCEIAVGRDGTVQGGAVCQQKDQGGTQVEAHLDGGAVNVSRRCRVTGQVTIDGYATSITEARLSRDRNTVSGKGTNAVDGSPLTFTATRQVADAQEQPRRHRRKRWWQLFF